MHFFLVLFFVWAVSFNSEAIAVTDKEYLEVTYSELGNPKMTSFTSLKRLKVKPGEVTLLNAREAAGYILALKQLEEIDLRGNTLDSSSLDSLVTAFANNCIVLLGKDQGVLTHEKSFVDVISLPAIQLGAELAFSFLGKYYHGPRIADDMKAAIKVGGLAQGFEIGLQNAIDVVVRPLVIKEAEITGRNVGWTLATVAVVGVPWVFDSLRRGCKTLLNREKGSLGSKDQFRWIIDLPIILGGALAVYVVAPPAFRFGKDFLKIKK